MDPRATKTGKREKESVLSYRESLYPLTSSLVKTLIIERGLLFHAPSYEILPRVSLPTLFLVWKGRANWVAETRLPYECIQTRSLYMKLS